MIKGLTSNPQQGASREASVDLSTVRVIIHCGVKGQREQQAQGVSVFTHTQAQSKEVSKGLQKISCTSFMTEEQITLRRTCWCQSFWLSPCRKRLVHLFHDVAIQFHLLLLLFQQCIFFNGCISYKFLVSWLAWCFQIVGAKVLRAKKSSHWIYWGEDFPARSVLLFFSSTCWCTASQFSVCSTHTHMYCMYCACVCAAFPKSFTTRKNNPFRSFSVKLWFTSGFQNCPFTQEESGRPDLRDEQSKIKPAFQCKQKANTQRRRVWEAETHAWMG